MCIGVLNIRSMCYKMISICEILNEHRLDILCLMEIWLHGSDLPVISAGLPKTHTIYHTPRPLEAGTRGGGVAVIYPLALSSVKHIESELVINSFEVTEVQMTVSHQTLRITVVYHPGHPGTDAAFMDEFELFLERFSRQRGRSLIW